MKSFTEATADFIASATWLTDADLPAVVSLQQAAKELDTNGVQAALLNTYGVNYRYLMKRNGADNDADEAEDFLNSL